MRFSLYFCESQLSFFDTCLLKPLTFLPIGLNLEFSSLTIFIKSALSVIKAKILMYYFANLHSSPKWFLKVPSISSWLGAACAKLKFKKGLRVAPLRKISMFRSLYPHTVSSL
jgi:hypothetical protein